MNNRKLLEINDADLIAIEEVKNITKESFKRKEANFIIKYLKENMFRFTILLMLSLILTKIFSDNITIIFILLGLYSFLIVILLINEKIEFDYYIKFYFKELEKRKIKIIDKNRFERFLIRYLGYKILNNSDELNNQSAYYFQKTKATHLTEEELFISVVIFPKIYDLIKEPEISGPDD